MDNNEALETVISTLQIAYDLKEELEIKLENIQNPCIHIKESKKKIARRLRLVNNVIYTGEKARLSLEIEIAREKNPRMKFKQKR